MNRSRIRRTAVLASKLALLACLGLGLVGCKASRKLYNSTLIIDTDGGRELGVSTEHGVVFLGRTARSGPVLISAVYGDGPGIESSVIEPLGGGLYTAETEIRLPVAPMSFRTPRPGKDVVVKGRRGRDEWSVRTSVISDPDVDGMLLRPRGELTSDESQVGAGVYIKEDGRELLVGLVSGTLELERQGGGTKRYVTVVGPADLWRLVTYRREYQRKRRWVYREDIL